MTAMIERNDIETSDRRLLQQHAASSADGPFHYDLASVAGSLSRRTQRAGQFFVVGDVDDPDEISSFAVGRHGIRPQTAHREATAAHQGENEGKGVVADNSHMHCSWNVRHGDGFVG